jgi:sugar lactone lactonase YvrE
MFRSFKIAVVFCVAYLALLSTPLSALAATLLYVTNSGSDTVSAISADGTASTFATGMNFPEGLTINKAGNVYVANWGNSTISKITPTGTCSTFVTGMHNPHALVFDSLGNLYAATDLNSGSISRITPDGTVSTFVTGLNYPHYLTCDSSDNLYFTNNSDSTIGKITPSGNVSTFATGFSQPSGMAFDSSGNLYVNTILNGGTICEITPGGSVSTFATGLFNLSGMCFDSSDNLYATGGYLVFKITPGGNVSTFATGVNGAWGVVPAPVPEPSTLVLLGIGAIGSLGWAWRRRKSAKRAACIIAVFCVVCLGGVGLAEATVDTFGAPGKQFNIEFVPISGATNPDNGIPAGTGFTFTGVDHDYRMGKFEITNEQWTKFKANLAPVAVTGNPLAAYDAEPTTSTNVIPTNNVSWYEATQFVNWLNTSTNHPAAYKFNGTQGTNNYTFSAWDSSDSGYNASNPFRNSNAFYYLPTESEWVKAAYWNGTTLQTYANVFASDLVSGMPDPAKWNYTEYNGRTPWNVGSGSQELNGTYDMMGNLWEWMESPAYSYYDYDGTDLYCVLRGGSFLNALDCVRATNRGIGHSAGESGEIGFRVASVPEPGSLIMLPGIALTALLYWWRKRAAA